MPATADGNNTPATTYVVLKHDTDNSYTLVAAGLRAHTAKAACTQAAREHVDEAELDEGVQLRAISLRSWDAGAGTYKTKYETRIVPL